MRKVLKDTTVAQPRIALKPLGTVKSSSAPKPLAAQVDTAARPAAAVPDEAQMRQWRQSAERAGYEAGLKQAQADAQARFDAESARVTQLMETIRAAHDMHLQSLADQSEKFAFAVLCRMLGETAATPQAVAGAAAAVMHEAASREVVLHVHPDDAEILRVLLDADGHAGVSIEPDAKVRLGGCVATSPDGSLDARFDTQLELLSKALDAARARRRGRPAP